MVMGKASIYKTSRIYTPLLKKREAKLVQTVYYLKGASKKSLGFQYHSYYDFNTRLPHLTAT